MRTLFLIGNGFDRNLNMNTRYCDFYEYYKKIKSNSEIIQKLKKGIDCDYETWACLEKGIGKHTSKLENISQLDEICYDLKKNLGAYLKMEEDKFDFTKVNFNLFKRYLCFPEDSLEPRELQQIKDFRNNWKSHEWYVDIITFNYTYSIDKILGENFSNNKIGVHHNNPEIKIMNLYHAHGYYDNRMVLGVNDESQIANEKFRTELDAIEELVKNECNKANSQLIEAQCENRINTADLIVIYGCSIGETDNHWWQLIGERLKHNSKLIIFYRESDDIDPIIINRNGRITRKVVQKFLNRTSLSPEEKEQIKEKIYVGINSKLFSDIEIVPSKVDTTL